MPGPILILFSLLLIRGACPDDPVSSSSPVLTYAINETGLSGFFDDSGSIPEPSPGQSCYGQDARYPGNRFSFMDNGDNTVSDLNTGLIWQKGYSRIAFTSYENFVVKMAGYLDSINDNKL